MLHAFLDSFFNHVTDPERIKAFWDRFRGPLMDWWLEDKPLNRNYHAVEHYYYKLEGRLFSRPKLWWVFEATEPAKHYMMYFNGSHWQSEDCMIEDEYEYLKRNNLFTSREKKMSFEPDVWGEDYTFAEISKYKVTNNNTVCSHWECHLDELDWKTRLGFAYGFEGYWWLQDYIDKEKYSQENEGNPFAFRETFSK